MPPVTSSAAAGHLQQAQKVLWLDTCALLDIVRLPMRETNDPTRTLDAVRHVQAAGVQCCVPEIVLTEWNENRVPVQDEVDDHLRATTNRVVRVLSTIAGLGSPTDPSPSLGHSTLPVRLGDVGQAVLDSCIVVTGSDEIKLRAYKRDVASIPPGKKGKACLKDCTVTETMLDVCRHLGPFHCPCVFLSSNKTDFWDGSDWHPALAQEFQPLNVSIARNWDWAAHSLGV